MSLLTVEEAQGRIIDQANLTSAEFIPLDNCYQRIVAEDIFSKVTHPPFDASAMDGYAVRFDDCKNYAVTPVSLTVVGESAAGHPFDMEVLPGQAVRIFTGAVVPDSCDAIAIQEDCDRIDNVTVLVKEVAPIGKFIRQAGYDFKTGDLLIAKGTKLNYRHMALLASMNISKVPVSRKPRVAIIATGDELCSPGDDLDTGKIISSIPFGMKPLLESVGAEADCLGIAKDNLASLESFIKSAQLSDKQYDIVVTIGGASVGDHDLVQTALKQAGMALDFWRIAMRPGKPLMVGKLGSQNVIGVPGNPVSALICCLMFVVPLVKTMLGVDQAVSNLSKAVLVNSVQKNGPRKHYMRAQSSINENGEQIVECLEDQDSSLQVRFAYSNCLIVRTPHSAAAISGDLVDIITLDCTE